MATMTGSERETLRRLPLLYLGCLPLAGVVIWLVPHHRLVTNLTGLYLLPLWIVLAHLLCGLSYTITGLALRRGLMLIKSSLMVYRGEAASLIHLQAALLVALAEEAVFRYALLGLLAGALGPTAALLITSLLFSLLHLRRGTGVARALHHVDLFVFALVLGGLTLGLESIYPALALHGVRNYILRCLLISREEYHRRGLG